jgi:TMEM175 potassium channel family protein
MTRMPRETRRREGNEIEFSRIVAFSDGVFAIAITLLVLSLNVPEHLGGESLGSALWDQRNNLLAYAISFAVIGRFWVVHHRFFSEVVGFDGRLLGLNILYLAWIVLIPFSSEVLGDHGGEVAAVVLYATNLAVVALVGLLMTADARRAGLADTDPEKAREFLVRSLFIAAVFLATIPLAFVNADLAPLLWLALFLDPSGRLAQR